MRAYSILSTVLFLLVLAPLVRHVAAVPGDWLQLTLGIIGALVVSLILPGMVLCIYLQDNLH